MSAITKNRLAPYSGYKRSDIPGVDDIPQHWEMNQLGRIGEFYKGSGGTKEDEVTSGIPCVRYGDIYTTHKQFIFHTRSYITLAKAADYTRIQRGDILFSASGETSEEIGKSAVNVMDIPVYCGGDLIIFRPTTPIDPRFAGYALDAPCSQDQKSRIGKGVSIMHIYSNQLKYLWLALPPLEEQAAIVRYLDDVDQRIREYVSAKERLIALLEEERQAVIHQAVTRGLEPNVKLKPSGVEWLGDVPEQWEVTALYHKYSQILGKMLDAKKVVGDHLLPYLRNTDVQWDRINVDDLATMDISPNEYERYTVRPGDLLVCEGGDVGRSALWSGELAICGFQKALHRLRSIRGDIPRFLYYVLRVASNRNVFNDGHVSTIAHLTGEKLRLHRFPFPPIPEQSAIVEHLDKATAETDTAIDHAHRQIELMEEYRTRLIADVVTGKIDVRSASNMQYIGDVNGPAT